MFKRKLLIITNLFLFLCISSGVKAQSQEEELTEKEKILQAMHSIHSRTLFEYVKKLASDEFEGRLTGTEGYNLSAEWVISHFKKWGISPVGDKGSYLQAFPNPYTLVFEDCFACLHIPQKNEVIKKFYLYEDEYIPGSTSGSGEVTAEVVYVGYGITAPELGFDEYKGVDVKGKIVLMEREAPVSPDPDEELFMKWRPYSFHQYKLKNAVAHGAKGMIYNYLIGNPNNAYSDNFIYTHVGENVVLDIFAGTGREHEEVVKKIQNTLKPHSFVTNKVFTIKNTTEHHPEGIGYNVVGKIEGSDPRLKQEVIIIGGHLDHLGYNYEIMPGANDNASAVAVIMGLAEVFTKSPVKLRRTILFNCFGAEEQGVAGSKYYVENPIFPLENTVGLINIESVGVGDRLGASAALNYPDFWKFFEIANETYIHRIISPSSSSYIGRPRQDTARFIWAGVPAISFGSSGGQAYYHISKDNIKTITPEIMEDLAQLLFIAILEMANQDSLNFRN